MDNDSSKNIALVMFEWKCHDKKKQRKRIALNNIIHSLVVSSPTNCIHGSLKKSNF